MSSPHYAQRCLRRASCRGWLPVLLMMMAAMVSMPAASQSRLVPFAHGSVPRIIANEPNQTLAERRRERFRQLRESSTVLGSGVDSKDPNPWIANGPALHSPRPAPTPNTEIHPALADVGQVRAEFASSGTPLRTRAESGAISPQQAPQPTNNKK
jgi:hypothetical protein